MQKALDRRQHTRVKIPGGLLGSVGGGDEVSVIDLSRGGAMIEHTERLAPGETRVLTLSLIARDFHLPARVVWSHPYRGETSPPVQPRVAFRSGLCFTELATAATLDLPGDPAPFSPPPP